MRNGPGCSHIFCFTSFRVLCFLFVPIVTVTESSVKPATLAIISVKASSHRFQFIWRCVKSGRWLGTGSPVETLGFLIIFDLGSLKSVKAFVRSDSIRF